MAKKIKENKKRFEWGEGRTAMFIAPTQSGSFELLDCRFREDREKLHEICGSKSKISRTGQSGSEIIFNMGSLIPVGGYRTDTANLDFYNPVDIKVNTKITKKGKIIFTNLGKKYYTELSKFSILLNISFSL